jgi:hypothetical protein
MFKLHQSSTPSSSWQVLDRQPRQLYLAGALRLQARRAGWLAVQRGQVWLTRDGGGDDHVLQRGEQFWLQAGDSLVIEPWRSEASAQLGWLLGAPAARGAQAPGLRRLPAAGLADAGWRGLAAVLRGVAGRLLAAARSAEAMASRAQGSIRAGDSMASCGALQ